MTAKSARWNNVLKIANRINELFDVGWLIYDEDGKQIPNKFTITEDEIYMEVDEYHRVSFFYNNPEFDEGLHTSIKEFNKQFDAMRFIEPKTVRTFKEIMRVKV